MLENATLKHEDCVTFLKSLPDNSVDMVAADPPYCSVIKDKWDNQWNNEEEYLDWCREWTEECFRVLKPGKCFYVWGTTKFDTFLRYKLDVLNKVKDAHYQNWIIWQYDWGGRTKKNFARKHEDLLMYSKGKEFDFYPDNILVERAVKSNMATTRKMTFIVNLDDSQSYEGGDLCFLNTDSDTAQLNGTGNIIIFPSFLTWKLSPVTKGEKNIVVGHVHGAIFR